MKRRLYWILAALLVSTFAVALASCSRSGADMESQAESGTATEPEEHNDNEVELSPGALKAAQIESVEVSEKEALALVTVTGTVEANQEKIQQATPLISGRVERVQVALGDRVNEGAVLAVISSPDIAEMHGKLHEAETRLNLGEQNLQRVQSAENRVSVLQAKARLDEAEANLRRTRRLIELGAAAGKDLTAAETAQATAKAEYDYQSNVSLSREVQEARAEVETTRVEVLHLRNSLAALGAAVGESSAAERGTHDTSIVTLRAPVRGTVIERLVNAGAGIEPGKPLFTIADISTLWVIANVPEGQISQLDVGTPAEIQSPELGQSGITGRIAYIDPVLNEETRTGRVRVEIVNPRERLKVGMFVAVSFSAGANGESATAKTPVVPDEAVQRIADRTVVFVPTGEPGHFEIRDVQLGDPRNGLHPVLEGLKTGERVVTKGSFVLKTQSMKGELGEHGH